jgi:hypothetical protein
VHALEKMQTGFLRRPEGVGRMGLTVIGGTSVALAGAGFAVASQRPDGIESLLAHYPASLAASHWSHWFTQAAEGLAGLAVVYSLCVILSRLLVAGRPAIARKGV